MIVDIGHTTIKIVPVYEGSVISNAIQILEFCGEVLTDYLILLMNKRGYSCNSSKEIEMYREMKEKLCYCSLDFEKDLKISQESSSLEKSYEDPNGPVYTLGDERFKICEPLFNPSIIGFESEGIHKLILNSILKCNNEIQKELFGNIILAGGSSMFEGISERLENEIQKLIDNSSSKFKQEYFEKQCKLRVIAPPERKYSTWMGMSMISSLPNFQTKWIRYTFILFFNNFLFN